MSQVWSDDEGSDMQEVKNVLSLLWQKPPPAAVELSAFNPILTNIVEGVDGHSIAAQLLTASLREYRYNERKVVFAVRK